MRLIAHFSFFIVHSSLVAQDDLNITLTPAATNTLTFQTTATTSDLYRIFESAPSFIGNQIDLRYPASFEISPVALPTGWQFQTVTLNNAAQEKVATWFYQGIDPNNAAESVNFATAFDLKFQIRALVGNATSVSVQVETQVSVYSSEFDLTFSGIVFETISPQLLSPALHRFRETFSLPADGSSDQLDRSGNGLPNIFSYAFGLDDPTIIDVDRTRLPRITSTGQFTYLRHIDQANDGLSYQIESTDDFLTWTIIDPTTPQVIDPVDATYERVTLTLPQNGTHRFYRLALQVD